jgi:hypothetical protein
MVSGSRQATDAFYLGICAVVYTAFAFKATTGSVSANHRIPNPCISFNRRARRARRVEIVPSAGKGNQWLKKRSLTQVAPPSAPEYRGRDLQWSGIVAPTILSGHAVYWQAWE